MRLFFLLIISGLCDKVGEGIYLLELFRLRFKIYVRYGLRR